MFSGHHWVEEKEKAANKKMIGIYLFIFLTRQVWLFFGLKIKLKKKDDKLENSSKAFEILTFVFLTLYLVKNEFKLFLDNWVKKKKNNQQRGRKS